MLAEDTATAHLDELPDVLTADQVAVALQCSTEHIYTMWRKRQLPNFRVGRLVRMHKQALIEWIESQQREALTG